MGKLLQKGFVGSRFSSESNDIVIQNVVRGGNFGRLYRTAYWRWSTRAGPGTWAADYCWAWWWWFSL